MANVLIIGASKGIGLEATKQALERGHRVRAFARSADGIDIDHPNLEKRKGDALKQDDVSSALAGMDVVIQSLGVAIAPEALIGPVTLFSGATRILVDAMAASGVKRLIAVTGYGAGDSRAGLNLLQAIPFQLVLGRVYGDKDVQEMIIKRSTLDWVIARPVFLTNGPRTGRYQVLAERSDWHSGFISRADVADFLIKQIDGDSYIRQAPVLAD